MEKTFVIVKPDGVQRGLIGEVVTRLERRGLKMAGAKFMRVSLELAETHYGIHKGKPFYDSLIEYITSAPVMAMVWQGKNAVAAVRQTMGATNPTEAAPGSVRHDYGLDIGDHVSRMVEEPYLREADLVLCMESGHAEALRAEFPAQAHKVFMITEMSGQVYSVYDPYGEPLISYQRMAAELAGIIDSGLDRIIELAEENSAGG